MKEGGSKIPNIEVVCEWPYRDDHYCTKNAISGKNRLYHSYISMLPIMIFRF